MSDLALGAQLRESPDGFLESNARIRGVQLVEIDSLETEPPQAAFAVRANRLRPSVVESRAPWASRRPSLGRDHEAVGIGMKRRGDLELVHLRPVGEGGVDQLHAELDSSPENAERVLAGLGPAEDVRTTEPHRAEAKPADEKIASDGEELFHEGSD
jgi:hypothetical protein